MIERNQDHWWREIQILIISVVGSWEQRLRGFWFRFWHTIISGKVFKFLVSAERHLQGFLICHLTSWAIQMCALFKNTPFFFFSSGITLLKTSYSERILKVEFLAGVYDCVTLISYKRQLGGDMMHKRTVCWQLMSTRILEEFKSHHPQIFSESCDNFNHREGGINISA